MKRIAVLFFVIVAVFLGSGWVMAFELTSSAFDHESYIPLEYTCSGQNISPELTWRGAPANTKSFVLICDDPDAPVGTWVHWVVFNIPADFTSLQAGFSNESTVVNGINQGLNDFQKTGYGGPCPPRGAVHRYFFKLYALDVELEIGQAGGKKDVVEKMQGHILDQATLIGLFKR